MAPPRRLRHLRPHHRRREVIEFGPGGTESVAARAGDAVYIHGHLVHRETVAPEGSAGFVVRTGAVGSTVHNVDGPDPVA